MSKGPAGRSPRPEWHAKDEAEMRETIYLHPGRLLACTEPVSIMTILGSCVAVCLWDDEARIGGMAHFVLPVGSAPAAAGHRFGSVAIEKLVADLARKGAESDRLRAKVFGGASVLGHKKSDREALGAKNVEVARRILEKLGIPVAAEDVGGKKGRKIIFHVDTGDAWVKAI